MLFEFVYIGLCLVEEGLCFECIIKVDVVFGECYGWFLDCNGMGYS